MALVWKFLYLWIRKNMPAMADLLYGPKGQIFQENWKSTFLRAPHPQLEPDFQKSLIHRKAQKQ